MFFHYCFSFMTESFIIVAPCFTFMFCFYVFTLLSSMFFHSIFSFMNDSFIVAFPCLVVMFFQMTSSMVCDYIFTFMTESFIITAPCFMTHCNPSKRFGNGISSGCQFKSCKMMETSYLQSISVHLYLNMYLPFLCQLKR